MNRRFRLLNFLFLAAILMAIRPVTAWAKPKIVLDAAHGGSDLGVKAGSQVEKEWNSKIVQALEKAFEDAGFEVQIIRKRDETISTDKRTELINTSGASVVIIIHADRDWTGTQKGPFLVVEPPNKTDQGETGEIPRWGVITPFQYHQSLKLAKAIALSLGTNTDLSSLSDNRGAAGETSSMGGKILCLPHQSLRYLTRPAIVLIPLFLTSLSDVKKFSKSDNLADFAAKVVQGTSSYLQVSP
jgi:N-acetylmuramoyl-L-alanine amidase